MTYGLLVLICCSALGSGLVAGMFFAFSAFVMTALGHLPPDQGIAAMQSINVAVMNPWFFAAFFGTAAACVVLAIASLTQWGEPGLIYLLAGSLLYLIGSLLVTILFNVPLNDTLAATEPHGAEAAALWTRFVAEWTAWTHVRTVASFAAAAAFILALTK
jgi:uncharacterized membrane protein